MKVKKTNLNKLIKLNIEHSNKKFVSKVSVKDVIKYYDIIRKDLYQKNIKSLKKINVLCLAVRNGREVDLFRICKNNFIFTKIIQFFEIKKRIGYCTLLFSFLEKINRSSKNLLYPGSVIGNEINPNSERKDIEICSFNELPSQWTKKFDVIYINSLDHTNNPFLTSKEIKRVIRNGGYLILAFPNLQKSGVLDPLSDINLSDIYKLFGKKILYYKSKGSDWFYDEYIIKIK